LLKQLTQYSRVLLFIFVRYPVEQEIQQTQDVSDTEVNSELHQLQQELQKANETIAQLQQLWETTAQSQGQLISDNI